MVVRRRACDVATGRRSENRRIIRKCGASAYSISRHVGSVGIRWTYGGGSGGVGAAREEYESVPSSSGEVWVWVWIGRVATLE